MTDTGEAQQLFRTHYGVFQPGFLFFKVFVGFWFKVNLLRSEISGSFQVIEIVVDLLGCKQPPDFTDEGRYFGSEQGIALDRVQEGEEFLADQIVQRVLQAELLADTFGCRALGCYSCLGSPVQDAAHGSTTDIEAAGDFRLAEAGAMKCTDLAGMESSG